MAKAIHSMIRVLEEARSVEFYKTAFGLEVADRLDFDFSVPDVDSEHARLTALGLAPRKLVDFAPGGDVIARFFFIADPDGYQIEVLKRAGRYL